MKSPCTIDSFRILNLLEIIKKNADYLKDQGLYKEILADLEKILPQLDKSKTDISK